MPQRSNIIFIKYDEDVLSRYLVSLKRATTFDLNTLFAFRFIAKKNVNLQNDLKCRKIPTATNYCGFNRYTFLHSKSTAVKQYFSSALKPDVLGEGEVKKKKKSHFNTQALSCYRHHLSCESLLSMCVCASMHSNRLVSFTRAAAEASSQASTRPQHC